MHKGSACDGLTPDATTEETLLGALFQRREPQGGRLRLRTQTTTPPDRLFAAASAEPQGGMSSARAQGFAPASGPVARLPFGGALSPWKVQEAAEEVEPRRGQ